MILEFDDVMVKTLYERGFLRLHLCDTRLPRFEELAYASLGRAQSRGDSSFVP